MFARTSSFAFLTAAAFLAVACGAGDASNSSFGSRNKGGAAGEGAGEGSGGEEGAGGTIGGFGNDGPTASTGTAPTTEAKCAAVNVGATQLPLYLVIIYDKSGSMGPGSGTPSRWDKCKGAMKSFFGDAKSKGISASIQFFPSDANACTVGNYTTPRVDVKALPNAVDFASALDATTPSGGTPTLPAVQGAIAKAQQIRAGQAAADGGKVAVVLVTDGEPNDCSSSVAAVATAVGAVKAEIPTYVIGVGNVANLNTIAAAGGTVAAKIVGDDAAKTAADLAKALDEIRNQALGCEYAMPQAPAGKTLDLGAVNVIHTTGAGAKNTLPYDKDCAGSGWRYDNPSAPSKIQLCPGACNAVKADTQPKVDVELGCATKGTNGQIPR